MPLECGEHEQLRHARGHHELEIVAGIVPAALGAHRTAVGWSALGYAVFRMAGAVQVRGLRAAALRLVEVDGGAEQGLVHLGIDRHRGRGSAADHDAVVARRLQRAEVELVEMRKIAIGSAIGAHCSLENDVAIGGDGLEVLPAQIVLGKGKSGFGLLRQIAGLIDAHAGIDRARSEGLRQAGCMRSESVHRWGDCKMHRQADVLTPCCQSCT
jgi:hypothetical protein